MNFKVKVRKLINNGRPMKAVCSVTVDGNLAIHNVKLIEKGDRLLVRMPCESWTDSEGKTVVHDVCHPVNKETRTALEDAVIAEYDRCFSEDAYAGLIGE